MPDLVDAVTDMAVYAGPSAQSWFAGGERVGYDPKARAIVATQDAPLDGSRVIVAAASEQPTE
jgi:hypothetical protein